MTFEKDGKCSWLVNGQSHNCRSSVKALVMQDYLRRNRLDPGKWTELPTEEFKRHHMAIKAIWQELGLE